MIVLYICATLAIVGSFLVESTSWWIKGACSPGNIGLYVSRSNIYLYFGRFFALGFNAMIAFAIENGAHSSAVALALTLGFALSAVSHLTLLRGGASTRLTVASLNSILLLPTARVEPLIESVVNGRILLMTAMATTCFCLGLALPLMLAVFVPQYRMSLSYIGQTVNAVGTILLLFMVDQRLFLSLDGGTLNRDLPSYSIGRALAFALAAAACAVFFFASR